MARKEYVTKSFTFDGKRYFVYGKDPDEVGRKAAAKLALLKAGVKKKKATPLTVERWAKQWLRDYKYGTVSDAWYDQMEGIINNYIIPEIGSYRLTNVMPKDIARMLNSHADLSKSHGQKIIQITRQIFDAAEENELIDKSPARHIKPPKFKEKEGYRTITDTERALTIKTAEKYPDEGLFFLIMLYTGCRPQEVCRLRMKDYDSEARILTVEQALKADGSTGAPKSRAGSREIPVPDVLCVKLDALKKKPNDLIVTSLQGRPLQKTSLKRLWGKFKRHMEIENGAETFRGAIVEPTLPEDLKPYCYRHTYCTDLQDAGVPVTVAFRLMGHANITITAEIYTHHSKQSFEDARDRINKHSKNTNRAGSAKSTTLCTTLIRPNPIESDQNEEAKKEDSEIKEAS